MFYISLILCLHLFQNYDCYRILGLNPYQGKSHFVMFERLYKELAKRGHEVDVLSHFPQKEPLERYTDLSLVGTAPPIVGTFSFSDVKDLSLFDSLDIVLRRCGSDVCKSSLSTDIIQKLKNRRKRYDLIITEIFGTDCMFGFAHYFNVSVVTMTTSVNLPWADNRFGNPDNPSYIPNYFTTYSSKMGLVERIANIFYSIITKFSYQIYSVQESDKLLKQYFGPDTPDLGNLINKYSSLHLVNSHYSLNSPRPWVPNVIEVGGLHISDPKPLDKHFEKLVDTENKYKGVIYFCMGSLVLLETFPEEIQKSFFEAFQHMSAYKFLIKGSNSMFRSSIVVPENVQFENWMPQKDILCHQNIKLFISHGGLMGSQEAVYCGVPLLVIPLFGDQKLNVQNMVEKGFALQLSVENFTKDELLDTLRKLLDDPQYKRNAQKVSFQFRDRPNSAVDTAIFWIEYVIRHNGAKELRTVGADLPFYQLYCIDALLTIFFALAVICFLLYLVLRAALRKILPIPKIKTS